MNAPLQKPGTEISYEPETIDEVSVELLSKLNPYASASKAMHHSFPRAQLLACTRHLKENVIRHLQDKIGSSIKCRNNIVSKIFGEGGLSSLTDVADFVTTVQSLQPTIGSTTVPAFLTYFENKIVPALRDNLLAGYSAWTSNNVESINHVLKQALNWKPHMLPDLITKLEALVRGQILDAHRAIFGRGDFKLRPTHLALITCYGRDMGRFVGERKT